MNRVFIIPVVILLFIVLDWYCYGAIKNSFQHSSLRFQKIVNVLYWSTSGITLFILVSMLWVNLDNVPSLLRNFIISGIFGDFIIKFLLSIFLFLEDITRLLRWLAGKSVSLIQDNGALPTHITRSEFLSQSALVVAVLPAVAMGYGIIKGAHDYKIRRIKIALPNLPASFDGLKIIQISDVHAGSFFNKTAVMGGVEMIMKERADVIFFTGDLVNNEAKEMKNWVNVFDKIKAPLGVYSTLGNHDYGDYKQWTSEFEKRKNLQDLISIHKNMGWNILMNEHKILKQGGDQIAILGVENWGKGDRWPKYGQLNKAHENTQDAAVKLLLSHDPSHWDAQVRPLFKDIDVMFAGHTHGFQFGIELGDFRWSPSQYVYKQWAGLYKNENQQLYVNRGFGYLGFPGRVGMPPEISVFELKKA